GFQAAEDFVRQAAPRPAAFTLFFDDPSTRYGFSLFGGGFEIPGIATFPGHQITTALVVLAIGFALHGRRRRWWGGPLVWLLPVAAWIVVVSDHAGYNAASANSTVFASGRSEVNPLLYWVWRLTGHGNGRGWLLVGAAVAAMLCDAFVQRSPAAG